MPSTIFLNGPRASEGEDGYEGNHELFLSTTLDWIALATGDLMSSMFFEGLAFIFI